MRPFTLLLISCACSIALALENPPKKNSAILSGEESRAALIELVSQSNDDVLKVVFEKLKTDMIVVISEDKIEINKWTINLKKRTFILTLDFKNDFIEFTGRFDQTVDGAWKAHIEKRTSSS